MHVSGLPNKDDAHIQALASTSLLGVAALLASPSQDVIPQVTHASFNYVCQKLDAEAAPDTTELLHMTSKQSPPAASINSSSDRSV